MADSTPLISIVIPAYNYGHLLPRAIQSVIVQLDDDSELLVIDDGSTDDTPQVLATLHARHPGEFRSIRKANGGASSARNAGITASTGRYLVLLDADDELAPDALAQIRKHIAAHPDSRFIIGGHVSVGADGERKTHAPRPLADSGLSRLQDYLLEKRISPSNGASVIHREVFSRGTYPEQFRNAEDIPVFAQALANFPCSTLTAPLAIIHKHDDSLRHNLGHALGTGILLVDEIFSPQRLDSECAALKKPYFVQRCLSLFRTCLIAGDRDSAKRFYLAAIKADWRALFILSYTRKALRLLPVFQKNR